MYCENCGNKLKGNAEFCNKCGKATGSQGTNNKNYIKIAIIAVVVVVMIIIYIVSQKDVSKNMIKENYVYKDYTVSTNAGTNITLKVNETKLKEGIAQIQQQGWDVYTTIGVIYKGKEIQQYIIIRSHSHEYNYIPGYSETLGKYYFVSSIDAKTWEVKELDERDIKPHGEEAILQKVAQNLANNNEFGIFTYENEMSEAEKEYQNWLQEQDKQLNETQQELQRMEKSLSQEPVKQQTTQQETKTKNKLTGIEQAVKDGKLKEKYITIGITEDKLRQYYYEGVIEEYYNTWEECLNDAQKLNIIITDISKYGNLTGIERAVEEGWLGDDYITEGVSRGKLEFEFQNGNLGRYYDTWEECLADARKLNIITSNEEYIPDGD